jgi:hypothetical protein
MRISQRIKAVKRGFHKITNTDFAGNHDSIFGQKCRLKSIAVSSPNQGDNQKF